MKKRIICIVIFLFIAFVSCLIYEYPKLMLNKSFDAYFYGGLKNGIQIESTSETNFKYDDQIDVNIAVYKKNKLIGDDTYKVEVKIGDDLYSTNGFGTRHTYENATNVSDYSWLKKANGNAEYPDLSLKLCITNDFSKFTLSFSYGGNVFEYAGPATSTKSANDIASNIYKPTK